MPGLRRAFSGIIVSAMVAATAQAAQEPRPDMIDALAAKAASPALGGAASDFDRFIGVWDLTATFHAADGTSTTRKGEWRFGWILGGHMVQDVIIFEPLQAGGEPRLGTTLRLYDSRQKQWRVIFFRPFSDDLIELQGGVQGDRILLLGTDVDGSPLRWSFNDVTPNSFHWIGEISPDHGRTWRVEQEMTLFRRS